MVFILGVLMCSSWLLCIMLSMMLCRCCGDLFILVCFILCLVMVRLVFGVSRFLIIFMMLGVVVVMLSSCLVVLEEIIIVFVFDCCNKCWFLVFWMDVMILVLGVILCVVNVMSIVVLL